MGWVVNTTPRPLYPREIDPVPIVQEAGWASGPAWTDAENLAHTGIRSPDRPARSQSLYRLSYSVTVPRLTDKLPAPYGTRMFVSVLTRARHLSIPPAK
jgi:hypothetical protein